MGLALSEKEFVDAREGDLVQVLLLLDAVSRFCLHSDGHQSFEMESSLGPQRTLQSWCH